MSLRMPKARDIRVAGGGSLPIIPGTDPTKDAVAGAEISASRSSPELVTVMGFGKDDVLFRSEKVNSIQVRDGTGAIVCMLIRVKPGIWGFSKRGDPDWTEVLGIYGNDDKVN